tara:strand:+ start:774 stop:1784 length:1011 start_codon:yes stop_codon:yes gene_type:complete
MAQLTGYEEVVKQWETFLKGSPSRFIRLRDTNKLVDIDGGRTGAGKTKFFWRDIQSKYGSVTDWMNAMILKHNLSKIEVYFRKKTGSNGSKDDPAMKDSPYDLTKRLQQLKEEKVLQSLDNTAAAPLETKMQDPINNEHQLPSQDTVMQNNPPQYAQNNQTGLAGQVMQGMGGAASIAHMSGLGMAEFIDLKTNANDAARLRKDISRVEEENSSLRIRLQDAESKLSIADASKQMAIDSERNSKRSWMDSEAAQKLLETAPSLLSAIMSKGQGQSPGLASPANSSVAKTEFVGYVNDDEVSDEMVMLLQQSMMLLLSKQGYDMKLSQLNQLSNVAN